MATNNNLSCGKTIGGSRLPRALSNLFSAETITVQKHTEGKRRVEIRRFHGLAQRGSVCTILMFQRLRFALAVFFFSPTYINIYMITKCLVIIEVKHKVSDSGLQIKEEAITLDTEEALFI